MTNEEAIKNLKKLKSFHNGSYGTAIDLAIKALETASCLKEKCAYCPHCEHCDVDDDTLAIKTLEQTSWIPCSERLPEDGQKVLVTTRSDNILDANVDTCIFYHASAFWKHYVIAWMPLPQPYKEEKQ